MKWREGQLQANKSNRLWDSEKQQECEPCYKENEKKYFDYFGYEIRIEKDQ